MLKNQCAPAAPVAADCTITPNSPFGKGYKGKGRNHFQPFLLYKTYYAGGISSVVSTGCSQKNPALPYIVQSRPGFPRSGKYSAIHSSTVHYRYSFPASSSCCSMY